MNKEEKRYSLEKLNQQIVELKSKNEKQEEVIIKGNKKLLDYYNNKINELDKEYNVDLKERLLQINKLQQQLKEKNDDIIGLKSEKNDWKQRFDASEKRYKDLMQNSIECLNKKLKSNTKLVCYKIRERFLKEKYFDVDIGGRIKYIEIPYLKFIKLLEQIEKGE